MTATIHLFLGTKAQYIKMAALILYLEQHGAPYRIIDSGQHARFSVDLRRELSIPDPHTHLGGSDDVATVTGALSWALSLLRRLATPSWVRRVVFGGSGGICVVHGDTPSTLIAALMARRVGIPVAHVEAGLRSWSWTNPFPEEIIRVWVMRLATYLYVPNDAAAENVRRMGLAGEVVITNGNTGAEALKPTIGRAESVAATDFVFSIHRVETLHHKRRLAEVVRLALQAAEVGRTTFVLHPPTRIALTKLHMTDQLTEAGVELVDLLPHGEFVQKMRAARGVITDGGSVQEECALLGTPTLLWRRKTERQDGLGENVVLSRCDYAEGVRFIYEPERFSRAEAATAHSPSAQIGESLIQNLDDCK